MRWQATNNAAWKFVFLVWTVYASLSAPPPAPLVRLPCTSNGPQVHRFFPTTLCSLTAKMLICMCDHRSTGKETSECETLESETIGDDDDDDDVKKENAEIESFEREEKRIVEEVERQVRMFLCCIYSSKDAICLVL